MAGNSRCRVRVGCVSGSDSGSGRPNLSVVVVVVVMVFVVVCLNPSPPLQQDPIVVDIRRLLWSGDGRPPQLPSGVNAAKKEARLVRSS